MSILIKNMKMPKGRGVFVCVLPDGTAIIQGDKLVQTSAVEIPPHGRLIDADALIVRMKKAEEAQPEIADVYWDEIKTVKMWLATEPTVTEAEVSE